MARGSICLDSSGRERGKDVSPFKGEGMNKVVLGWTFRIYIILNHYIRAVHSDGPDFNKKQRRKRGIINRFFVFKLKSFCALPNFAV